jgi:NADPH:quinone reductase
VHAAAGGMGLFLCQWAAALGATVLGTISSEAKAQLAHENGCRYPIIYTRENVPKEVDRITGGERATVVYDGVGRDTFMPSLDCLRRRGRIVSFGEASGPVPALDIGVLGRKGSLTVSRGTLLDFICTREELLATAGELIDAVIAGRVRVRINQTYPLREAAAAHRDLEGRRTTGSTILLP